MSHQLVHVTVMAAVAVAAKTNRKQSEAGTTPASSF
jgi:hypothetical protein